MHGIAAEKLQAAELADEFGMQVWTDLRSREDGAKHWHARKPGWLPQQIISGYDAGDLRDRLILHGRLTEAADSLLDEAAEPGAATATG